jgi:hypothetical protein
MFDSNFLEFRDSWTPNTEGAETCVVNIFYNGVNYFTWPTNPLKRTTFRPIIIEESVAYDPQHGTGTPEDTLENNGKYVVHYAQGGNYNNGRVNENYTIYRAGKELTALIIYAWTNVDVYLEGAPPSGYDDANSPRGTGGWFALAPGRTFGNNTVQMSKAERVDFNTPLPAGGYFRLLSPATAGSMWLQAVLVPEEGN